MAGPERTETKGEDKKEDEEDRRLSETRLCVCTYVHIYIYGSNTYLLQVW